MLLQIDIFDQIHPLLILKYLMLGIILYIAIYLVNNYVIPLLDTYKEKISKWWGRLQFILWISFFSMFFYQCLLDNLYISLAFGVLVFGLGWNFWRNIFSGVLIQFNDQFKEGDYISTDFATGELKRINLAQSELLNDSGELVIIPNFKLRSAVLKHMAKKSNVKTFSFEIKKENLSLDQVRKKAINCPYVSANQPIIIDSISGEMFSIKVALIDVVFVDQVREWFAN